jgi:hypothetical protein
VVRRVTTLTVCVFACSVLAGSAHAQNGQATSLAFDRVRPLLGSASFGSFTVHGHYDDGSNELPTASSGATFDDPREERFDSRAFAEARYGPRIGLTDVVTSLRYDRYRYRGQYTTSTTGLPAMKVNTAEANSISSDLAIKRRINAHGVAIGAQYRGDLQHNLGTHAFDTPDVFLDVRHRSTAWAATIEDELKVHRNVVAYGAVRYDDRAGVEGRVTPRASLVVRPSSRAQVKALFGNESGVELSLKTGADVGVQTLWTGAAGTPVGNVSNNAWVSNATVTKAKLPAGAELGATIYNLFDSAAQDGRRFVGNLTWNF